MALTATRTTVRNASDLIVSRKPFTAGGNAYGSSNFRGDSGDIDYGTGRLNDEWRAGYEFDRKRGILFVVWSYGTPIAWFRTEGFWVIVDQKFSSSTSRHQSAVRSALS